MGSKASRRGFAGVVSVAAAVALVALAPSAPGATASKACDTLRVEIHGKVHRYNLESRHIRCGRAKRVATKVIKRGRDAAPCQRRYTCATTCQGPKDGFRRCGDLYRGDFGSRRRISYDRK